MPKSYENSFLLAYGPHRDTEKHYLKFKLTASEIQSVGKKSAQADERSKYKMRHRLQRERGEDLSLRLITPLIACQVLT